MYLQKSKEINLSAVKVKKELKKIKTSGKKIKNKRISKYKKIA
jgi:hypothetical protein